MFEGDPLGFQTQLGVTSVAFVYDEGSNGVSQQRDYIGEGPPGITSINVNGKVGKNLDVLILQTKKSLPSQRKLA